MDNLMLYLLKVSAGTIFLYIFYVLFFSKDTFYKRNRILLILILILPIGVPFLKIFYFDITNPTPSTDAINNIMATGNQVETAVSTQINSFNFYDLLIKLYFSIGIIVLIRGLIGITKTLMIIRKGIIKDKKFPVMVLTDSDYPVFSFFPYIVIPKKIYESGGNADIIEHENTHIRQAHTLDILLVELSIAFQWFNPFIWLIKRSIILNHEYLADKISIRNLNNSKEYQYKLLTIAAHLGTVPLAHSFSSSIKNRLIMINRRPSSKSAVLKNIFILPVAAMLLVMFSFRTESDSLNKGKPDLQFSKSSMTEILKFVATNTKYPLMARSSFDTGKVFVLVKMHKGGIIEECKAFSDKKEIKAPILPKIVIVGYQSSSRQSVATNKSNSNHPALKSECIRAANMLGDIDIPEWKDKNMEFGLAIEFVIKPGKGLDKPNELR